MPAFRKTSSALPVSVVLADCLEAHGQVLVIDEGLVTAAQATHLAHSLPASLSADVSTALRLLSTLQAEDLADPWREPDAVVQPGALRVYEAALRRPATAAWCTPENEAIPWAAWAALADGVRPAAGEYWMQLLPCRIGLSAQAVGLIPLPPNGFTPAQVETMAALVSSWPATLVQSPSGTVYLRSEQPFGLAASAPEMLMGLHLAHHPPDGPRSRDWRQLSNEIQMAFHLLPDAEDDAHCAQTPWPWGAGRLPTAAAPPLPSPQNDTARPPHRLALEGLHHWLLQKGDAPSLRWWQPQETAGWVEAWLAALQALAALTKADCPWILMATLGGQARVWASANHTPPRWYERLPLGGRAQRSAPTLHAAWLALATQSDTDTEA
ncbi:MAG: hypothetical protein ACO24G_09325 [Burkholderiaceae bacterium]